MKDGSRFLNLDGVKFEGTSISEARIERIRLVLHNFLFDLFGFHRSEARDADY